MKRSFNYFVNWISISLIVIVRVVVGEKSDGSDQCGEDGSGDGKNRSSRE